MKVSTKELTICAMFCALIVIGAFIKIDIPLPLYTMHFTLQWLFVMMASFLLGSKLGCYSVFAYVCLGLLGLPVFAAGGGIGYIFRPGFGFLLGFVVAAFIMGLIVERAKNYKLSTLIISSSVGLIIYYLVGAIYFYLIKNIYAGEKVSFSVVIINYCLITVLPDFILCVFASFLCVKIKPVIDKVNQDQYIDKGGI